MKVITSACFAFSLGISAFALAVAPASAFETPALTTIALNHVIKVYDDRSESREREERREHEERERREARERNERCEHARHECHERHGDGHEFRECVEKRGC